MVRQELRTVLALAHLVGVFFAAQARRRKAIANLHALDGVDAHKGRRKLAIQLAIDRRAQTGGNAVGHQLDHRAHRRALFAQGFHVFRPARHGFGVGTEEGIVVHFGPVPVGARDLLGADGNQRPAHGDFLEQGIQNFARHCASRHPRCGLARAGTAAAAIVAHAILGHVGVIGMAGTKLVADLAIVLRPLVFVLDQQRNRRAGRDLFLHPLVLEDAGENLHRVALAPLGDEFRCAGLALVQPGLDVGFGQRNAGRAAIDDTAQRDPVAFTKGGDAEQVAEAVVTHSLFTLMSGASTAFMPTT